ncbi:MAG TPA: glycosyltransferase, partial [Vicinamibacterales bacterium]|nr:glycosyltransferase [Vicinamibacterales bacterium]
MGAMTFWMSAALVGFAYAGYPLALALMARLRSRPVTRDAIRPPVTFVITAHNEEQRLAEKLHNTLAQDYPASLLEIIVASDCSTDGTDDIARSFGDRVRLVRAPERRGKEAAQQLAVQASSGEILVFSDVATAVAPDGVSSLVANFADPSVGCVSSVDRFVDADGRTSGEGAYVRYEMFLRTLETRVNSLVGL